MTSKVRGWRSVMDWKKSGRRFQFKEKKHQNFEGRCHQSQQTNLKQTGIPARNGTTTAPISRKSPSELKFPSRQQLRVVTRWPCRQGQETRRNKKLRLRETWGFPAVEKLTTKPHRPDYGVLGTSLFNISLPGNSASLWPSWNGEWKRDPLNGG